MPLTLDALQAACRNAAAIRRNARLQPAGGPGDKVYPPTYEGGQYAKDTRVIDGVRVPCVLLDSVQSQANRMELALLEAQRAGRIRLPVVSVDFSASIPEVGVITSLEAPHRLADAILRDALCDGKPFRQSPAGHVLDTASVANATGLFELCPTALVFGLWDSAGPRGGLGTKFARALVSELVAVDAEQGVRPASRLDPLGIERDAGTLYQTSVAGEWTLDPKAAKLDDKKKPLRVGKEGKPSEVNHGNVTPSLSNDRGPNHGGVTFAYARQTAVLSLAALRRLRFPAAAGAIASGRDEAAHAALAALAICAVALSVAKGLDLRSRCLLVPEAGAALEFEIVGVDGAIERFSLTADEACALFVASVAAAEKQGLPWRGDGLTLTPRPEFVELVKKSRALAVNAPSED